MNLGEKIKNARAARQMSQSDLAGAAGISLRTIQNYESGARMPKSRDTYAKLADALGVDEKVLLDENADFVLRASEQYGGRGARQAWDLVADFKVLAAGGEIEEEDMDEIMRAMQEAYWEAKKNNRKYVNKRYRNGNAPDDGPSGRNSSNWDSSDRDSSEGNSSEGNSSEGNSSGRDSSGR